MKATELRIGNLITDKYNKDIIYKFVGYYKTYGFHVEYDENTTGFIGAEFPEPIPLTEEWLVKFGFEKKHDNEYCIKNFYYLIKNEYGYWLDDNENGINNKPILYVHTLQNLYFALTGKELVYESN